ncbi:MAG: DUF2220 family protein [Rhodocyclaceae bacterium]
MLNFLVDRLDAADELGRPLARAIKLDAKSFPALYAADLEEERERYWALVKQMALLGWFELKTDRLKAGLAAYEATPRLANLDEGKLRALTGRTVRVRSAGELWRAAVMKLSGVDDDVKECVARMRLDVPGRSADEVAQQLALLPSLADEPLLLREVSARLFWGLSKVLDGRQQLVAGMLKADECPFPEMPIQLQVFLPRSGFNGVLFIENLATFEQATRDDSLRYGGLALVYAAGFKAGARRLRSTTGSSVYFAAHGAMEEKQTSKFLAWLRAGTVFPCWFWGDLDHSGMRILAALRRVFDGLAAWEPGYQPMLVRLLSGQGHAPESGLKAGQKAITATGCAYADVRLLPAITQTGCFVDQEVG